MKLLPSKVMLPNVVSLCVKVWCTKCDNALIGIYFMIAHNSLQYLYTMNYELLDYIDYPNVLL